MQFNIFEKVILSGNVLESYLDLLLQFDSLYMSEQQLIRYVEVYYNKKNIDSTMTLVQTFWEEIGPCDDDLIEQSKNDGYADEEVVAVATELSIARKCEIAVENLKILEKEIKTKKKEWRKDERVPSGLKWNSTSENLRRLFNLLIDRKYLDSDTEFADFDIAFNDGIPKKINWTGHLQDLAFFLVRIENRKIVHKRKEWAQLKCDVSTFLINSKPIATSTFGTLKSRYISSNSIEIDSIISKSIS